MRGSKQYELTDHLGNIRTVVPDIKEPLSLPQNQNFRLPTLTLNNYYPYGMLQAGRTKNAGGYRFGFNGMEQTKGVQGNSQGTFYDYKNRDYDPWKIRFNRVDPITAQYPMLSPYQFASNRPIDGIDMDGLEWAIKSVEDGVIVLSLVTNVYIPTTINKSPQEYLSSVKASMENKANNSGWETDGYKVQIEVTLNPVTTQQTEQNYDGYYIDVQASNNGGNGRTVAGSNSTQKAFIHLYLNKRPVEEVARTILHEAIVHGWRLEHPYIATSDIYEEYKKVAMYLHDMMGKTLGPCTDCDEINQNLSTTGEIPPFEFNGIPTQYEDIDKTKITEFGYALLYNLHTPNFTAPQGTQLIDAQLNSGIGRIRRQSSPNPTPLTPIPATEVKRQ